MKAQHRSDFDFFISYAAADKAWAEWIAWTLKSAGYSIRIQAWHFDAGSNFALEMQTATAKSARTIAVLSPHFLESEYTASEWGAAFAADPRGEKRKLVPARIMECKPEGLLSQIVYIDLVGLDESSARERLLSEVKGRAEPAEAPRYPGTPTEIRAADTAKPPFPGERACSGDSSTSPIADDSEPLIQRLERLSDVGTPSGRRPGAPVEPIRQGELANRFGARRWQTATLAVLLIIFALLVWQMQSRREHSEPIISGSLLSAEELGLRKKVRPIQPGTSVGTSDVEGTGTICCIVRASDGSRYILSNIFHGSVVIQPGPLDQGKKTDQIGMVAKQFQLDSGTASVAGIARLLSAVEVSAEMPGLGRVGNLARDVQPGQTVRMVGRTSGLVEGKVTAINVTESIAGYKPGSPVSLGGLIRTTRLSQGGDAGAPVLTMNNELVGMVVGGSQDSTVVMPLSDLLEYWKVELVQ